MPRNPAKSPADSPSQSRVEPEQLSSVLTSLGALRPQYTVRVYEINSEGHPQARGKFTADKCDEFSIAERFGGGEYRADVVDSRGMIHRQVRVYVPADVVAATPEPAPSAPPAPRADDLAAFRTALLAEVRDLVRSAHAPAAPAAAPSIDLTGIAALLTSMNAPLMSVVGQRTQQTPIGEMIDAVDRLAQLRGVPTGAADELDDVGGGGEENAEKWASIAEAAQGIVAAFDRMQARRVKRPDQGAQRRRVENEAGKSKPAEAAGKKPAASDALHGLASLIAAHARGGLDAETCAASVEAYCVRHLAALTPHISTARSYVELLTEKFPALKAHEGYLREVEQVITHGGEEAAEENAGQEPGDNTAENGEESTNGQ